MYDVCPTQYAPDLRASRLCMQGTQYVLERAYCVLSILWLYNAHRYNNKSITKSYIFNFIALQNNIEAELKYFSSFGAF